MLPEMSFYRKILFIKKNFIYKEKFGTVESKIS